MSKVKNKSRRKLALMILFSMGGFILTHTSMEVKGSVIVWNEVKDNQTEEIIIKDEMKDDSSSGQNDQIPQVFKTTKNYQEKSQETIINHPLETTSLMGMKRTVEGEMTSLQTSDYQNPFVMSYLPTGDFFSVLTYVSTMTLAMVAVGITIYHYTKVRK